tara:strand:+ start:63345 stop:63719 length:375 start_codon:yes stop_codon:yes gene_type:complete
MAALEYLRRAGLTVVTVADKLRVTPVERITPDLRQHIMTHKAELLAELDAANEAAAPEDQPRSHEPARHTLTAATASPEWHKAREQYINHLMGCRACHAPTSRYCVTGADLRQQYTVTPMEFIQ